MRVFGWLYVALCFLVTLLGCVLVARTDFWSRMELTTVESLAVIFLVAWVPVMGIIIASHLLKTRNEK